MRGATEATAGAPLAPEGRRKERLDRGLKVRTEGLYAIGSWREISYLVGPRLLLVLTLVILPLVLPNLYWQRVLCVAGAYALLAVSFDFLANYVGLVCVGGAFMTGIGGYLSGVFTYYLSVPWPISIFLGTVLGAALVTLLWLPSLPLRGIYFAILTFMFPFLARGVILALDIFGGTEGLGPVSGMPSIWVENYLVIVVLLVAVFGLRRLVGEDAGIILRGVKDNDMAVQASGISVTRTKAKGLFIGSLAGCFAGAYIVHLYNFMGTSLFATDFSILPIAATVMGGSGTLAGPMLGALILTPLSELLRGFGQLRVVLYALVLVAFIMFKPEGLLNWLTRKYHQFEKWTRV